LFDGIYLHAVGMVVLAAGRARMHNKLPDPDRTNALRPAHLILLLPYIALLWPAFYARTEPVLFGFPFFYWYQFVWVLISAVVTAAVYLMTRTRP
jgi:Protein of unknown function (DUF3311)